MKVVTANVSGDIARHFFSILFILTASLLLVLIPISSTSAEENKIEGADDATPAPQPLVESLKATGKVNKNGDDFEVKVDTIAVPINSTPFAEGAVVGTVSGDNGGAYVVIVDDTLCPAEPLFQPEVEGRPIQQVCLAISGLEKAGTYVGRFDATNNAVADPIKLDIEITDIVKDVSVDKLYEDLNIVAKHNYGEGEFSFETLVTYKPVDENSTGPMLTPRPEKFDGIVVPMQPINDHISDRGEPRKSLLKPGSLVGFVKMGNQSIGQLYVADECQPKSRDNELEWVCLTADIVDDRGLDNVSELILEFDVSEKGDAREDDPVTVEVLQMPVAHATEYTFDVVKPFHPAADFEFTFPIAFHVPTGSSTSFFEGETWVGSLTGQQGVSDVETVAGTKCAETSEGTETACVALKGLVSQGTYKGPIDVTNNGSSEDAITLTVNVAEHGFWAVLAIVAGLLFAILIMWWKDKKEPQRRLGTRAKEIQRRVKQENSIFTRNGPAGNEFKIEVTDLSPGTLIRWGLDWFTAFRFVLKKDDSGKLYFGPVSVEQVREGYKVWYKDNNGKVASAEKFEIRAKDLISVQGKGWDKDEEIITLSLEDSSTSVEKNGSEWVGHLPTPEKGLTTGRYTVKATGTDPADSAEVSYWWGHTETDNGNVDENNKKPSIEISNKSFYTITAEKHFRAFWESYEDYGKQWLWDISGEDYKGLVAQLDVIEQDAERFSKEFGPGLLKLHKTFMDFNDFVKTNPLRLPVDFFGKTTPALINIVNKEFSGTGVPVGKLQKRLDNWTGLCELMSKWKNMANRIFLYEAWIKLFRQDPNTEHRVTWAEGRLREIKYEMYDAGSASDLEARRSEQELDSVYRFLAALGGRYNIWCPSKKKADALEAAEAAKAAGEEGPAVIASDSQELAFLGIESLIAKLLSSEVSQSEEGEVAPEVRILVTNSLLFAVTVLTITFLIAASFQTNYVDNVTFGSFWDYAKLVILNGGVAAASLVTITSLINRFSRR